MDVRFVGPRRYASAFITSLLARERGSKQAAARGSADRNTHEYRYASTPTMTGPHVHQVVVENLALLAMFRSVISFVAPYI